MKQEVGKLAFFAIIVVVVLVVGFFLYRQTESPYNRGGFAESQFRKIEEQAKRQGLDLRKDPMLAPMYYKYHPEEKPPAGLPNPMAAGAPPPRASEGGSTMPLAPPPPLTGQ